MNWLSSWFTNSEFSGPARNAPNNGINIKNLLNACPQKMVAVTEVELTQTITKLRKTKTNAIPPLSEKPKIMQEFDQVFENGYKAYFESLKQSRKTKTPLQTEQTLESLKTEKSLESLNTVESLESEESLNIEESLELKPKESLEVCINFDDIEPNYQWENADTSDWRLIGKTIL